MDKILKFLRCLGSIALQNSSTDASRRHSSVSDVPSDNVLRKVASLVLDGNSSDQRLSKPKAVPEKLDYHIYDKFEGEVYYVGLGCGIRTLSLTPRSLFLSASTPVTVFGNQC